MQSGKTYQKLQVILKEKGRGFVLLLDPDKLPFENISQNVEFAVNAGVDAFLVGGSFLLNKQFDTFIQETKRAAKDHPVILFPGSLHQLSPFADAILFLSVISGRNPEHLIGSQVIAAPILWKMQLEAISCGYMLIESGALTSAQFLSNSFPIPRSKPEIALAHALAAQYLGMKTVYLEAGSGAKMTVPEEIIQLVSQSIEIPIFVGGGILTPEEARKKANAGASFVVVGNFFEDAENYMLMREFADAIHG
jgi:putative glycerol-1-phosphate prenyltransferase